jgi:hypothetical protein
MVRDRHTDCYKKLLEEKLSLLTSLKSLLKNMNDFSTEIGFGKIHNTFAAVFKQYDDIDDLFVELDSEYFQVGADRKDDSKENRAEIVVS